ncbi:MAG: tRNA pseudouridine(13) synthase TruD [Gemmataceae bacterium]
MIDVPLLTAHLPGTGGRIKEQIDDFEVEEIPAYEPCGTGEHLYLWIEKRDMGAEFFARQIAQRLGIRSGDIGTAGMKDRQAVTRQWVSVPAMAEANLSKLEGDGIQVLTISRHTNKLRPGHLRGNRFRVLIREPVAAQNAQAIIEVIAQNGLPNFYGEQRFGHDGETSKLGFDLLHGRSTGRVNPFLRKLALSAAQSALFNDYLSWRMSDGLLRSVLPGEVLAKWPAGGMFVSTEATVDQPRLEAREIVPAGPMFGGAKMFAAADVAAERESAVLAAAELTPASFHGFGSLMQGTRRHNFVYVDDLVCNIDPEGLRVTFTLPSGSYATVLLREVMKAKLEATP